MHTRQLERSSPRRAKNDLLCILDRDPAVRRIIGYRASRVGAEILEIGAIDALRQSARVHEIDRIFLGLTFGDGDAIDALHALKNQELRGTVHLMGPHDEPLLLSLDRVGRNLGLSMGRSLAKPPLRSALDEILDGDAAAPPESLAAASRVFSRASLRTALQSGEVEVCYQLRFDLRDGTPIAAEAFGRRSATSTTLTPLQFGDCGGDDARFFAEHVIESVLRDWPELASPEFKPRIALRLPLRAIPRIELRSLLQRLRPADPEWPGIVVEIPEAQIAGQGAIATELAAHLRLQGLQLAVDAFGTAGLPLHELCALMPQELNIDQSLVAGCAWNRAHAYACQSVVLLARAINARAIAGGIETEGDLGMLMKIGCEIGQGEQLAPVMSAREVADYIRSGARARLPSPSPLPRNEEDRSRLSGREAQILPLVTTGLSSKQIAQQIGLSPRTVESYRARLMHKFGARNVVELTNLAQGFAT